MLGCDCNPGPLNFTNNRALRRKIRENNSVNFKDIYVQENTSHRNEDKILRKKTFSLLFTRGVVARRDTEEISQLALSSEFVKPRKISNMNKIFGEKMPHLHLYPSSQFRIRGGQHLQTGNCERDIVWTGLPRGGQGGANCPRASQSSRGPLKAGNSNLKTEF